MDPSLEAKLDSLAEYTRELAEIAPRNLEAFQKDKMLRRYAERMLHMAIECCLHIGIGVLTDSGFRAPENYHDIFIVLGDHGVLSPLLVRSMTSLVELRNLLVYEYDTVDDVMVYAALRKRVEDLEDFRQAILAHSRGEVLAPAPAGLGVGEFDD